jgi:hypothetical protein
LGGNFLTQKKKIKKFKKKFEWGTPTLENPEIAGEHQKSGFS